MIISKSPLKIVATILAKDEEDIIGRNIEHHVNQGVTHFIVTNNRSKDRTAEIASRYKEVVEVIDEPDETHNQSKHVTKMARMACKLEPDWIVHLDADELWCGLSQLRHVDAKAFASTRMYLHPPHATDMSYYLDFDHLPLPGECKVGHRPDPDVLITHGNHGFANDCEVAFTDMVWRHHYPIRSYRQFSNKAGGHLCLKSRNSVCERWERWYNLLLDGRLDIFYAHICEEWETMIRRPNSGSLLALLDMWSTSEVIQYFKESEALPKIGRWPRR